jgi:hypothetical protein
MSYFRIPKLEEHDLRIWNSVGVGGHDTAALGQELVSVRIGNMRVLAEGLHWCTKRIQ